jgi:short-subunit dehydrogenase
MNTETTLITGASSGIGLHLAHEFARHGHPLVLVAPVEAELQTAAAQIQERYGIAPRIIAKNLERPASPEEIFEDLNAAGVAVDILVNNAGHGFRGEWWEQPIENDLSILRLNVEAVQRMTKLFLRPMMQRGHGRLLNVASVAGFEPGPLLASYHASKAFVLSWTEALATELKENAISVTALCPGPTDTDFFPKADMLATKAFQGNMLMAPQDVAIAGYEGLMKGEMIVIPGGMNKALVAGRRVLSEAAQARLNMKFYENVPIEDQKRERGDVERAAAERR